MFRTCLFYGTNSLSIFFIHPPYYSEYLILSNTTSHTFVNPTYYKGRTLKNFKPFSRYFLPHIVILIISYHKGTIKKVVCTFCFFDFCFGFGLEIYCVFLKGVFIVVTEWQAEEICVLDGYVFQYVPPLVLALVTEWRS